MSKVQGLVADIEARDTKVGTMYNFKVNGESYGAGKFPPKNIKVGDYIEFNVTMNGNYKNMDTRSATKIDKPSGEQVQASRAATSASNSSADAKQEVISKQAARNTAVAFMAVLGTAGALPVAASAKPATRYEALTGVLNQLTEEFYNYSQGKTSTPLTDDAVDESEQDPASDDPWAE